MYPSSFDYYRADSVDEALSLLDDHADEDPTLISGGHSLVPTMKSGLADPGVLVDVGDVAEMTGIERDGDVIRIGASTRYADVVDDATVQEHLPMVAEATAAIGDKQVRERGTFGGNVAHSDPASDLPAVVLATDATIHAQGPDGHRTIEADDYFLGIYMTDLRPGEILTRVDVPTIGDGAGAYAKKPSPSSGYAMIGVAARLRTDGDTVTSAGVAANGAMDHAIRLDAVESAVEGQRATRDVAAAAAERATDGLDTDTLMGDLQASPEYRAQLLESYTRRALQTAVDRL